MKLKLHFVPYDSEGNEIKELRVLEQYEESVEGFYIPEFRS